jgi:hypothetical protein
MFSLQQNPRTRGRNRFCLEAVGVGREVAQTMYTHVSKCKNDKVKGERKKLKRKKRICQRKMTHKIYIFY